MKRLLSLLLLLILSINLLGCSLVPLTETKVKNLLSEKYGESFEIKEVQSKNFLEGYTTYIAYPSNETTCLFKVSVDNDGKRFSDNYAVKQICKELTDIVEVNLDTVANTYVHTNTVIDMMQSDNIAIDLYDFASERGSVFNIYVYFDSTLCSIDSIYNKLELIIQNLSYVNGTFYIYDAPEGLQYSVQNYVESNDTLYNNFNNMVDSYYVDSIGFKEGF
ncbi:MAG: hypothetical protein IJZ36_02655, partial [Bacilli bacterium]|nr:hypothetical protein [Bacilli bacterium]